ncbi:Nucleic acid-binding, OB-fold, partial [Sesbania bispinosa]
MAYLGGPFDLIRNVTCGRDTWRLKVCVVRIWEVCARDNPSNIFSVEMGGRIQANIRKAMLRKYMNCVAEGGVYKMTYFGVVDNGGSFRATSHEFKLLFQARTRVLPAKSVIIPRFGGVVKCSLFGYFIDIMNGFMLNGGVDDVRILVIQFAKVKKFLGVVSIQTVTNSSRLLWNPQIPEAISFKNGIIEHGFDIHLPLGVIGDNERGYTLREEFITLFPRKIIEDLQLTEE